MDNRGFTLVELMAVIIALLIMVNIAVSNFIDSTDNAHVHVSNNNATMLSIASESYYRKHDKWPISEKVSNASILSVPAFSALGEIYKLDKGKYESYVEIQSGELDNYGLIINGPYEGKVFHLDGIMDENGNRQYATNLTDTTNVFSVNFKNGEDVVDTQMILEGDYPKVPEMKGSNYSWDHKIDKVYSDMTYQYTGND